MLCVLSYTEFRETALISEKKVVEIRRFFEFWLFYYQGWVVLKADERRESTAIQMYNNNQSK